MRHRTGNQRTRVSDQRTRIEGNPTFKGYLETSYIGKGDIPVPLPNCSSGRSSLYKTGVYVHLGLPRHQLV